MLSTISLLYPSGYDQSLEIRMSDFNFIHSLQIDEMIILIRESYRGFADLELKSFYTTSPEVLNYRLAIVEDLLEHKELFEMFSKAVSLIYNINDLRKAINVDFTIDAALGSVRYLEMYQEIIELFSEGLKKCEVRSEGLKEFRRVVLSVAEGEEYRNLCRQLAKMEMNFGYIKSVTIGVNLDGNLRPCEAGILEVSDKPYRPGNVMARLLRRKKEKQDLMSNLFPLLKGLQPEEYRAMNYSLTSALHTIFTKSLRGFEPDILNYFQNNTAMFVSLLNDIRFLTAGVSFIKSMREKGYPMCRPTVAAMEEKKCRLEQVYNPMLVRNSVEEAIVSNSFEFDERGRFYLVTGPNHGGKSIFAYSVGMAQALFQLGLFVPAKSAVMSPVSGIYTHFPSSDENNYGKGRLESECARLSEILKELKETDMLLMDESFSSTSGLEAGYIASEVLTGIGVIGCCGIFVTHIHDLPQQVEKYNSHPLNKGKIDNLVALMENKESGKRSYRISRTTPDGLSYARDIAKRYGLNLEGILGEIK